MADEDVKTEIQLVIDKPFGAVYARWAASWNLLEDGHDARPFAMLGVV